MKVLRIITRLNIGGPSIHAQILHTGLPNKGIESLLVHGTVGRAEGDMGYLFNKQDPDLIYIKELKREISPISDLRAFLQICLLIAKIRPEIIHTHMSKAGTLGRFAGILLKSFGIQSKLVHTFHGHIFEGYFSAKKTKVLLFIERFLGKRTDALLAITNSQKEELCIKYLIAPCSKFKVVPLGFDLNPFLKTQRQEQDITIIGIVGRLVPIKNHELFLNTAAILAQKIEKILFWIIGDGEKKDALTALSRELGIAEKVRFKGWVKDMAEEYSKMDILVMTSLNEGTPVSIIEAMASGVAVISTDVGGVKELLGKRLKWISEGKVSLRERGILCHTFEPSDLSEAVSYLLNMPKEEREPMRKGAREFVEVYYSKERLLEDIYNLYKGLVGD